jgi:N-acyl-D-amino-acid deacylase
VIAAGGIATTAQTPAFDLVIVNATIVDGTGAPARRGDVAIRDGRIVRIGSLARRARSSGSTRGARARARVHRRPHARRRSGRAPARGNFVRMGVTTIVAGNCGTSRARRREALTAIRDAGPAVNFATLVGHNTVREAVMRTRAPTLARQLSRMRALVLQGHGRRRDRFLDGPAVRAGHYAKSNEIIELARVSANAGGIYATHMRNEGTALLDAIDESIRVAETLRMPLEISHLKVDSRSRWGTSAQALQRIDAARARGLSIQADQYAYTAAASTLSIRFPSWASRAAPPRSPSG